MAARWAFAFLLCGVRRQSWHPTPRRARPSNRWPHPSVPKISRTLARLVPLAHCPRTRSCGLHPIRRFFDVCVRVRTDGETGMPKLLSGFKCIIILLFFFFAFLHFTVIGRCVAGISLVLPPSISGVLARLRHFALQTHPCRSLYAHGYGYMLEFHRFHNRARAQPPASLEPGPLDVTISPCFLRSPSILRGHFGRAIRHRRRPVPVPRPPVLISRASSDSW